MNVAIMGAGISGLACTIILENHGIFPTIFESRNTVGDRFVNGEIFLNILNRPVNNCLLYFANKYNIFIKPTSEIKELKLHSQNFTTNIRGNLGYCNIRGRHKESSENQLYNQINSNILFNKNHSIEKLSKEFSHLIVSTGDGEYAAKANNYNAAFTVSLKAAIVEGIFNPFSVSAWLNNNLAPKGYCYLIPLSNNRANIVIAYPDYPENHKVKIEDYWERFYNQVCKDTGQNLQITDTFQIRKYMIGKCIHPKINNIYFTGNCLSAVMPMLGFGQFSAILSGIYAAYSIIGKSDYTVLTKTLRKCFDRSLILRRKMETFNNKNFDIVVKSLNNKLAYWAMGDRTCIDFMKYLSYLLMPFNNTNCFY